MKLLLFNLSGTLDTIDQTTPFDRLHKWHIVLVSQHKTGLDLFLLSETVRKVAFCHILLRRNLSHTGLYLEPNTFLSTPIFLALLYQ